MQRGLDTRGIHFSSYPVDGYDEVAATLDALLSDSDVRAAGRLGRQRGLLRVWRGAAGSWGVRQEQQEQRRAA